jgi:ribokinase
MKKIIVFGSINMDLVVQADRVPEGGETITGIDFQTIPGGKGANQAVAIARMGGEVEMIGRVGNDSFGDDLIRKIEENRIQIEHIKKEDNISTGIAMIVVEKSGQNRIIIIPGANGGVSNEDVDQADELFKNCDFLVMQLEIPLETVAYAAQIAKSKNIITLLNAAPAPTVPLKESLLNLIDFLIVNETEAEALTGISIKNLEEASQSARILNQKTNGTIIITLGEQGALVFDGADLWHAPSFEIVALDTTAAGDAFIGGLVASLHRGNSLSNAVVYANAAGALAATKFGAQPSLPTMVEIEEFISAKK